MSLKVKIEKNLAGVKFQKKVKFKGIDYLLPDDNSSTIGTDSLGPCTALIVVCSKKNGKRPLVGLCHWSGKYPHQEGEKIFNLMSNYLCFKGEALRETICKYAIPGTGEMSASATLNKGNLHNHPELIKYPDKLIPTKVMIKLILVHKIVGRPP